MISCLSCAKTYSKLSRPQRVKSIINELVGLSGEYDHWLNRMPENLLESELASELEETITQLEEVVDILSQLDLPRGFGR